MNSLEFYSQNQLQLNHTKNNEKIQIPLRFKGIILNSLFQKYRKKQLKCLENTFFKWYIRKNNDLILKDKIDSILIGQKQKTFTVANFFYRMKNLIRKQKQSVQNKYFSQKSQSRNQQSQIKCPTNKKMAFFDDNLSEYFQSLKNIFSMKIIKSKAKIQFGGEQQNLKYKQAKYKTQGCQRDITFQQEKSFEQSVRYQQETQKQSNCLKQQNVKQLGRKVSLTIFKTTLLCILKRIYLQAFTKVSRKGFVQNISAPDKKQNIFKCIQQLEKLASNESANSSSTVIKIDSPQINSKLTSNKSIQSSSQISSILSIPQFDCLNTQISQIQYSIQLLNETIKKDEQIRQLCSEFQKQYQQFQVIQKDFSQLKIRAKNNIFETIEKIRQNFLTHLKSEGFNKIKKTSILNKFKVNTCKSIKNFQAIGTLSKSRVNIQTLHDIFSKPLESKAKTEKQDISQSSYQQTSMTSIKIINAIHPKSEYNFGKIRSGIKKQTLKSNKSSFDQQKQTQQMLSSFGQQNFANKLSHIRQSSNPNNLNVKSHVNFKFSDISQKNQLKIKDQKKDPDRAQLIQQGFKKKITQKYVEGQKYVVSNKKQVYDLSIKTLSSDQSCQTRKYHAQIKSQYWWNDCLEEKQNLVKKRDQIETSLNENKTQNTLKTLKTQNHFNNSSNCFSEGGEGEQESSSIYDNCFY